MKKIILFLALLSLGVSKAQVVGGYLPVNSTKSATMGGLRVNGNEVVTGTFSVGSTATITGNALFSSSVLAQGNFSCNGIVDGTTAVRGAYIQANGTNGWVMGGQISGVNRIDNNSGTFRFLGSANTVTNIAVNTMSLGSANLTGGNTGTVAVLSDAVFGLNLGGGLINGNGNPADGSTFYFTNTSNVYSQQGAGKIYIPYNCTLVGWSFTGYITSVASSSESSTLSINIDNSATSLNTSITFSVAGGVNTYSASGLGINVNANSYIEGKIVNPTWATNPQGLVVGLTFWFVRRS